MAIKTLKDDEQDEPIPEGRGRSANRREALSFDALALKLIALSPQRCARFPVSKDLLESLRIVHQTKSKAARRRHLRHLSGMLRESPAEVQAIEDYLAGREFTAVTGNEENQDLEELREALCAPETFTDSLARACEDTPALDVLLVRELCESIHALAPAERDRSKPYRLLFKELRRAVEVKEQLASAE